MKTIRLCILCFLTSIGFMYCQSQPESASDINGISFSKSDSLTIQGNRIWVRSKPVTGTLAFVLNDGDVCRIIERGVSQTIGTTSDYWYHIAFGNQKGWVFGGQTSSAQKKPILNFQTYIRNVLNTHFFGMEFSHSQAVVLQQKHIGYFRLYNPGAACVLVPFQDTESYTKTKAPKMPNATYFEDQMPIDGFCERSTSSDGVYFQEVAEFPSYIVLSETYTNKEIDIPAIYKRGKKMKVVILHDGSIYKTLYCIAADYTWWLVMIDDCDCSA